LKKAINSVLILILAGYMLLGCASGGGGGEFNPTKVIVTMSVLGQITFDAHYFIAFDTSENIISGPQGDGRNWTDYIELKNMTFYIGKDLEEAQTYTGEADIIGTNGLRVEVPFTALVEEEGKLTSLKINLVTSQKSVPPLAVDALGEGVPQEGGYIKVDLSSPLPISISDPQGDCNDPDFDIISGEIELR